MRVLIVGCGYVGLPLGADLVRRGHEVFGLRRHSTAATELKNAGIHPLFADVTGRQSLDPLPRDFEWVVNCAASSGGGEDAYRQLYLEGSRNLISWLKGSPLKKFIYTSSTSVYAQNDGSTVTEASVTEPSAPTARILVETEKLLLAAAAQNFPAIILRVAGIYGPGRGHAFKQFLSGEARLEGDGSRIFNMIHRTDLIGAIVAALEGGVSGKIYNVVDNEPVTQRQFFSWLSEELKRPLPPAVPTESLGDRKRGMTNKRVSNARLRADLKYEFLFPNFRAGYAEEIARIAPSTP